MGHLFHSGGKVLDKKFPQVMQSLQLLGLEWEGKVDIKFMYHSNLIMDICIQHKCFVRQILGLLFKMSLVFSQFRSTHHSLFQTLQVLSGLLPTVLHHPEKQQHPR